MQPRKMAKKHNELLIDYPYLDLDQKYVRNEKLYFRRNILSILISIIGVKINFRLVTKYLAAD